MSMEKTAGLLNAIKNDPKAKELLKDVSEPRNEEDMIRLCAEIASKLGFDVSEADIRAGVAALAQERKDRTAADVEKLPDSDVEQAAGGMLWDDEDAPDGHEYNCALTYHSNEWQIQNGYKCNTHYLCPSLYRTHAGTTDMRTKYPRCASAYFTELCSGSYYDK